MLWWSAVIWFLFEALNFRLQDWYYVFLPDHRVERWLGITLSLATVVPAVLLPARLLEYLGVGRRLSARPLRVESGGLRVFLAPGRAAVAPTPVFPRVLPPPSGGARW